MPILFTASAARQWSKLPARVRGKLMKKLTRFAETGAGDIKRLQGRPESRLRMGDWRVIFTADSGNILVAAVGHRRDIYD
jgi:mRNA interferase RelE/StbE